MRSFTRRARALALLTFFLLAACAPQDTDAPIQQTAASLETQIVAIRRSATVAAERMQITVVGSRAQLDQISSNYTALSGTLAARGYDPATLNPPMTADASVPQITQSPALSNAPTLVITPPSPRSTAQLSPASSIPALSDFRIGPGHWQRRLRLRAESHLCGGGSGHLRLRARARPASWRATPHALVCRRRRARHPNLFARLRRRRPLRLVLHQSERYALCARRLGGELGTGQRTLPPPTFHHRAELAALLAARARFALSWQATRSAYGSSVMSRRLVILCVCALAIGAMTSLLPTYSANSLSFAGEIRPAAVLPHLESVYAGPVPPVFYVFHLGSIGIVYRGGGGDQAVMEIYGIDEQSEGQLLLFVTQPQVDAVQSFGLVAASEDQTVAVVVWEDRNVTIAMGGPENEGKVHYVTLRGGLDGPVMEVGTRLGSAPGSEYASPSGTLTDLQLGTSIGADDCVDTPQSDFSGSGANAIYISAIARNKPPGVTLQSIWSHSGDERVRFDYTPDFHIQEYCVWFFIDPSDTEFTTGDWQVELTVNGALQGALSFQITP